MIDEVWANLFSIKEVCGYLFIFTPVFNTGVFFVTIAGKRKKRGGGKSKEGEPAP